MESSSRSSVFSFNPFISFTIAVFSLGFTSLLKFRQSEQHVTSTKSLSGLNIFSVDTIMDTTGTTNTIVPPPLHLSSNAKTNRTLWQLVSTTEFHAGVQRVEPDAWIPAHAHETEEIIVIISGEARIFEETGMPTIVTTGSFVHIKRNCRHAIQNVRSDQPLVLVWTFPSRLGVNKFQFHDNYNTT